MQLKKQQLEPDMEQQTSSKLEKQYVKAIYCHPVYLTYMKSISREMTDWMNHKLEKLWFTSTNQTKATLSHFKLFHNKLEKS